MSRLLDTLRDSAMCWPSFTIQVHVPPWHWRYVPFVHLDNTPTRLRPNGSREVGWWGVDVAFLMVEVALGWNKPAFTWEST